MDSAAHSLPPPQIENENEKETEPELKKLKMSSTTSGDEADRKPRYKRRKVAIFLAYCGVGYQGMQKNPGAKTIEGDLEEALYHSGAIPEEQRGKPQRFEWARSARTDKGVSAVGQVVSGRFYIDPPGFVHRLNSRLPDQIRVFGFKRVTNSFSAKKFCDKRRYVYLIPVFALDPNSHPTRETVLASLGSENELLKCSECPDRGRKVPGVMGKRPKIGANHNIIESLTAGTQEPHSLPLQVQVTRDHDDVEINLPNGQEKNVAPQNGATFVYGEKEKHKFNRILSHYVGTHNFHNFTTRIKAEDPSAVRYIMSFKADSVVTIDGFDFVKCEVVGQSFMLHQIRKLVGLAVAIMRNCAPESLIDFALNKDVSVSVPTAPEVGLYLDECFFTSYNQKWKESHEEVSMDAYAEQAEEFKMKQVHPHIASMEQKEGSVAIWLHSLNCRNYPDLRFVGDKGAGANGANIHVDTTDQAGDSGENTRVGTTDNTTGTLGEHIRVSTLDNGAAVSGENVYVDMKGDIAEIEGENTHVDTMDARVDTMDE